MPRMNGAAQLRLWIDNQRMNQREAGALFQVHWTHVNQILSGRRKPGLAIALRIYKTTKIPVDIWSTPEESAADALRRLKERRKRERNRKAAVKLAAKAAMREADEAAMDELAPEAPVEQEVSQ